MSSGVNDWSALMTLRLKNLVSFGSLIRPLSTAAPVLAIESNVKNSGENPVFWMVKTEHGLFFGLTFREGAVLKSIVGLPPGMVTVA